MSYVVAVVANEYLDLAQRDGEFIDPMKIQKLVYLAHGWHLALAGPPLITENVEAWPYGPVIRDLYNEFRKFRASPIHGKASVSAQSPALDSYATRLIGGVWAKFRPFRRSNCPCIPMNQVSLGT